MNKFYYNKKPFLTKEEEISLAKRIEKGDKEAFKILIESNLGLALKIANDYIFYLKDVDRGIKKIKYGGSLRRKEETIGDIDLLVVSKNLCLQLLLLS